MSYIIKTNSEIEKIQVAASLTKELRDYLCSSVCVGISTMDLDDMSRRWIDAHDCKSAFLNYHGYPSTVCVSVNEEIIHGVPSDRKLKSGDVVGIDIGLFVDGWCGDTARTVVVQDVHSSVLDFLSVSKRSLQNAIELALPGNTIGHLASAMQTTVEGAGYNVIEGYGGHGIGKSMHEDPYIPCRGVAGEGLMLKNGMVLALEVMTTLGNPDLEISKKDGWTVSAVDDSLSAHFEDMVVIMDGKAKVLT